MINVKVDVRKIDHSSIYIGEKGSYLTFKLIKNKGGKDKYGNDGFVAQEPSKEKRTVGEKWPLVGNWRLVDAPKREVEDDISF